MNKTKIKGEWTTKELEKNKDWFIELDDKDNEELVKATQFSVDSNKNLYLLTSKEPQK